MLYTVIDTAEQLQTAFAKMHRDHYCKETYEGLVDYFEEVGDNQELDVIAICCDLHEMPEGDIRSAYGLSDGEDIEEYLQENTSILAQFEDDDGCKVYSFWAF